MLVDRLLYDVAFGGLDFDCDLMHSRLLANNGASGVLARPDGRDARLSIEKSKARKN